MIFSDLLSLRTTDSVVSCSAPTLRRLRTAYVDGIPRQLTLPFSDLPPHIQAIIRHEWRYQPNRRLRILTEIRDVKSIKRLTVGFIAEQPTQVKG